MEILISLDILIELVTSEIILLFLVEDPIYLLLKFLIHENDCGLKMLEDRVMIIEMLSI